MHLNTLCQADEQVKLSISEAARRAGVNRTTLHRRIEKGELSKEIGDDGKPVIDLSELARLYPAVVKAEQAQQSRQQSVQHANEHHATDALLRENSLLRETVDDLRRERDRLLGVVETQTKLISDQRPQRGGFLGLFRK